jgi:hypothetical protein
VLVTLDRDGTGSKDEGLLASRFARCSWTAELAPRLKFSVVRATDPGTMAICSIGIKLSCDPAAIAGGPRGGAEADGRSGSSDVTGAVVPSNPFASLGRASISDS